MEDHSVGLQVMKPEMLVIILRILLRGRDGFLFKKSQHIKYKTVFPTAINCRRVQYHDMKYVYNSIFFCSYQPVQTDVI